MPGTKKTGPRNSRPPRPRALAQRRLRPGLPPTVALRTPAAPRTPAPAAPASPALPSVPLSAPVVGPAPAASIPAPEPPSGTPSRSLRLRGDYWEVRYDGGSGIVADSRGMRYIALLIARAGRDARPLHARELVALASGESAGPIELEAKDEVLDSAARRQLADRLEEIAAERDRAVAADRLDEATGLDEEFERIVLELRHAEGGGRKRRGAFTDEGERARKAVAKAIAEAVARIAGCKAVAPLAGHLTGAVRKGQWLSYTGDSDWDLDFSATPPRK